MLSVNSLNVRYGRIQAVRNARFHASESEIVCFVGSNGAGKSSVILGTMGLVSAEGEILLNGMRLEDRETRDRISEGLAFVPEGRHVFPNMTVEENLLLGSRKCARLVYRQRLEEAVAYFPRLAERIAQKAGTMSGGEQQMLAIARALMSNPRFLLLDEPTLGLAPIMVNHLGQVLLRLRNRGLGIIIAEQNLHMAFQVSDRGYVIQNGEMIMEGTVDMLQRDPRVRSAYLGLS